MDWIERLFHISPDGGNGTVEFVIYVVLVTVASLTARAGWRFRGARRQDRRR
jgi:hypothetical protein